MAQQIMCEALVSILQAEEQGARAALQPGAQVAEALDERRVAGLFDRSLRIGGRGPFQRRVQRKRPMPMKGRGQVLAELLR